MNSFIFILMIFLGPVAIFVTAIISMKASRRVFDQLFLQLARSFEPHWRETRNIMGQMHNKIADLTSSRHDLQKMVESIKHNVGALNGLLQPMSSRSVFVSRQFFPIEEPEDMYKPEEKDKHSMKITITTKWTIEGTPEQLRDFQKGSEKQGKEEIIQNFGKIDIADRPTYH